MSDIKTIKDFGASMERLIGYFYAGLVATLIVAILEPESLKKVVETLGSAISVIISIAIGIGLYTIYYQIIGEFILFQFQRFFHYVFDLLTLNKGIKQTSTTGYVGYLGVPFLLRRRAYDYLKKEIITGHTQKEIELSHGELHVLYLTSTYCILAAFYCQYKNYEPKFWLLSGLIFLLGAFIADTRQHIKESQIFKTTPEEIIKKSLKSGGFLK